MEQKLLQIMLTTYYYKNLVIPRLNSGIYKQHPSQTDSGFQVGMTEKLPNKKLIPASASKHANTF
jgi:hypothetical protein